MNKRSIHHPINEGPTKAQAFSQSGAFHPGVTWRVPPKSSRLSRRSSWRPQRLIMEGMRYAGASGLVSELR